MAILVSGQTCGADDIFSEVGDRAGSSLTSCRQIGSPEALTVIAGTPTAVAFLPCDSNEGVHRNLPPDWRMVVDLCANQTRPAAASGSGSGGGSATDPGEASTSTGAANAATTPPTTTTTTQCEALEPSPFGFSSTSDLEPSWTVTINPRHVRPTTLTIRAERWAADLDMWVPAPFSAASLPLHVTCPDGQLALPDDLCGCDAGHEPGTNSELYAITIRNTQYAIRNT